MPTHSLLSDWPHFTVGVLFVTFWTLHHEVLSLGACSRAEARTCCATGCSQWLPVLLVTSVTWPLSSAIITGVAHQLLRVASEIFAVCEKELRLHSSSIRQTSADIPAIDSNKTHHFWSALRSMYPVSCVGTKLLLCLGLSILKVRVHDQRVARLAIRRRCVGALTTSAWHPQTEYQETRPFARDCNGRKEPEDKFI